MPSEGIAAAIAHNISPTTFLKHYRSIRDAETEHKSTGSAVQAAKKAAKSDGVDLDALRMLQKLAKLDSDEAELRIKHMMAYAQWAELPLGTQTEMFGRATQVPEDEAEKQREFNASEEGKRASEGGQPRDSNPHADASSPEFVSWDKAWLKANRKFLKQTQQTADEMGRNAGVTTASRGRRRNGSAATAH